MAPFTTPSTYIPTDMLYQDSQTKHDNRNRTSPCMPLHKRHIDLISQESRYLSVLKTLLALVPNPLNGVSFFGTTPVEQACAAPINRLPVEVLVHIFFLSLENYSDDCTLEKFPPISRKFPLVSLSPGSRSDPMVLAQVCMLWRAIALSTPLLWSKLAIHCGRRKHTIALLKTWLERSGNQPLTFFFFESLDNYLKKGNAYDPAYNPLTTEVIKVLVEHSHRWKSIDFRFARQLSSVLIDMVPGSVPILESAAIMSRDAVTLPCPPRDGIPPLEKVWNTMHSSPMLKSGEWEVDYLESPVMNIPWSTLTTIDVAMTSENLFSCLPKCHNLTTLRFTDPFARYHRLHLPDSIKRVSPPLPDRPVTLPYLRELSLITERPADQILERLTLPALKSFYVEQQRAWHLAPDPSVFAEFLNRSECHLERYSYNVMGAPQHENVLLEILGLPSMSFVSTLKVISVMTEKLLRLLTRADDRTMLLPRLMRLALGRCKECPSGTLANMVQSRRVKNPGLEILRDLVVERWEEHPEDIVGLKRLAEQAPAIDFTVEYQGSIDIPPKRVMSPKFRFDSESPRLRQAARSEASGGQEMLPALLAASPKATATMADGATITMFATAPSEIDFVEE
ncbi:hypothetical protein H0H87_000231 [Tephrocybe sp. NHM501043]|nr:hypothetical protein H0H87_000231 [Tephrocybe sp. NHM501043]